MQQREEKEPNLDESYDRDNGLEYHLRRCDFDGVFEGGEGFDVGVQHCNRRQVVLDVGG